MAIAQEVFFARQPICDPDQETVAWELLYRAGPEDTSMRSDPREATARLLVHLFSDFDVQGLLEGRPAFVNFPAQLLLDPPDLDPKKYVIQVDAQCPEAAQLVEPLTRLWSQGYKFSLNNYTADSALAEIVQKMPYVRFNLRNMSLGALESTVSAMSRYLGTFVAGNVENHEEFAFCRKLGVQLFQGYFFCRPHLESGRNFPESKLVVMRLLDEVRDPDRSIDQIQRTMSRDPRLGYRLLRLVNSAQFRRAAEIRSLQHALTVLGMDKLRSWITLIALCELSDKPATLQMTALFRARMCEQLAVRLDLDDPEMLFTAGLFSLLDAFFDRPMAELLGMIHVAGPLRRVLEGGECIESQVLQFVLGYESGQWEQTVWDALRAAGAEPADAGETYTDATRWAIETMRELSTD